MLTQPEKLAGEAADWLLAEASRYVKIAEGHADHARILAVQAAGSGQIKVNTRRRDQFVQMALEAAKEARRLTLFAAAIRALQRAGGRERSAEADRLLWPMLTLDQALAQHRHVQATLARLEPAPAQQDRWA